MDTKPPQPLGSHPVIDPVNYPVNMRALDSPRSSDTNTTLPVNLPDDSRADLVEAIQQVAKTMGSTYTADEHTQAENDLLITIGHYLGDEAAELWEHEWKVAGPQTTPAGAEQKLNHFIGHMVQTGYPITAMEGAA